MLFNKGYWYAKLYFIAFLICFITQINVAEGIIKLDKAEQVKKYIESITDNETSKS